MKCAIGIAGVLALFNVLPASADVLMGQVDRGLFNGNDFVDWGSLGPAITLVTNPVTTTSNGGLSLNVSEPVGTDFTRVDQGNGWDGNFAPGDSLLWTSFGDPGPGPITIDFASPISGAGAQIQDNRHSTFLATIDVYNGGTLLGSFTEAGPGFSTPQGDNTAIFIGIKDLSGANITRLVFSTDVEDFAINRMDLLTQNTTPVPEPSSLFLVTTGLGAALVVIRRRFLRRAAEADAAYDSRA